MEHVNQDQVAEARAALRALGPDAVLVAPAGEVWRQAATTLGEGGTVPLIDLCSALSARERIPLARRVLEATRGSEAIAVIEPLDVQSPVPDLPIRAELPGLGARIRVGPRDLGYLAQHIGGAGSHAGLALEVAGQRASDALRDAFAGHLSADPFDLPLELWAILAIVERGSLDLAPFLELARAVDHEYASEIPRSIALARWDDFVRHELDAVQSANSPASEAEVWDQLWCLLSEDASFALPENAQPLLLRALRAGVDPARTAGLLLMHGWETEAAIAALTPIIEEQLAGYEGEYDDEIDLSTMVWAVRRSGASSNGALRLLALVGEHAAGHLLGSVASALAAIGGAEARRLLASYVERERRRPPSPRRSTNEFDAATLMRLEIELGKLDGVDGRALFHELWSREAGLFADMALIDALDWLMDVAPDDILAALEKALAGGRAECVRAQPFLRALGHAASPLAAAIRAAHEGLFEEERLELLWTVTGDRDAARERIGREGALHQLAMGTELFDIAAADAVSEDAAARASALDALRRLAPDSADPLWLCFYAALQELRDADPSATPQ